MALMFEKVRYQKGANWICKQIVLLLHNRKIVYDSIRWSTGKKHYILTVRLPSGFRFARFAPVCLLGYEEPEIKMVIEFLLKQLVEKLEQLVNEHK